MFNSPRCSLACSVGEFRQNAMMIINSSCSACLAFVKKSQSGFEKGLRQKSHWRSFGFRFRFAAFAAKRRFHYGYISLCSVTGGAEVREERAAHQRRRLRTSTPRWTTAASSTSVRGAGALAPCPLPLTPPLPGHWPAGVRPLRKKVQLPPKSVREPFLSQHAQELRIREFSTNEI